MGSRWYLAMDGWEFANCTPLPAHVAWLGCTFSYRDGGVSGLPDRLPEGSVLIFSDLMEPDGYDPKKIAADLQGPWAGILLDLQRDLDYRPLLDAVCARAGCPVAVTEMHAKDHDCAVFLSPPLNIPLPDAAKPWQGRTLWADGAVGVQHFTVTETGCQVSDIIPPDQADYPTETPAFCRMRQEVGADYVRFSLYRDVPLLEKWVALAHETGIETVISLYGEIKRNNP